MLTYYNDFIKVDKAASAGASPIYSRSVDENIFYDDARICLLKVPLTKGKEKEAVIQTTSTMPESLSEVSFMPMYDTDVYTVRISVPQTLSERITISTANFPESAIISKNTDKKGNIEYCYTIKDLKEVKLEPMGQSPRLYMPRIMVQGIYKDLPSLYKHLREHTLYEDTGLDKVAATASQITRGNRLCRPEDSRHNKMGKNQYQICGRGIWGIRAQA